MTARGVLGMRGWTDLGSDVSWDEYGGLWGRKAPDGSWYVVRFDASESEGGTHYASALRVALSEVSPETMRSVLDYIGAEHDAPELERVYACVSDGCSAPLSEYSGSKHAARLRAQARRTCETLMIDDTLLNQRLDRSVNRIGTTAREFGQGDTMAGLRRYQESPTMDPVQDLLWRVCGRV